MKKLKYILILLILPLLLTACTKKQDQNTIRKQDRQQEQSGQNEEESMFGSFVDLLKTGKNVVCTAETDNDERSMKMKVYAAGEKSYSENEITMKKDNKVQMMYSVFDGEWAYNWDPETKQGTKVKIEDVEELGKEFMDEAQNPEETETQQYQDEYDYKCRPWVVDNDKFTVPEDVQFMDVGSMMQNLKDTMTGVPGTNDEGGDTSDETEIPDEAPGSSLDLDEMMEMACKACDSISDATQKAECKAKACN